jgi:RNA polymerase sigma-70 factor (ECF subfamily)
MLIARHRDRMWAVALRTMRDPEDAADALQDACISAVRAAESFRAESAVTTWLHRIVVNACLDRMRRRKVRPTVPLDDQGPAEPAMPRDAMADRELTLDITAALSTLPEDQRLAIVLVDVQGYPVADAAAALQVAEGTIKSRCARGRARLAVQLGHLRNRPAPDSVEGKRGSQGPAPVHGGSAPGPARDVGPGPGSAHRQGGG